MTSHFSRRSHVWLFFAYAIAFNLILVFHAVLAQQTSPQQDKQVEQSTDRETDEEERRRMFRTFKQQRQTVASSRTKIPSKNTSPSKPTTASEPKKSEDAFIGFTVWEMRPSETGTERRSFRLKKPNGQSVVLRPFRLKSDTPLVDGQSYVFSIESARPGYLYIIDREQYTGGVLRNPSLLFPTKGVRGGSNEITAGNVVEIPDQKTETAYFEATRNGQGHIGEVLTIIVSAELLIDPSRLKDDPITLKPDEVEKWEQRWAAKTRWAENAEAVGRAYTEEEGQAGGDPSYRLKEGDPLPQRLYHIGSKAGTPLIVTLILRYTESANAK
jgi:hypothetical protein